MTILATRRLRALIGMEQAEWFRGVPTDNWDGALNSPREEARTAIEANPGHAIFWQQGPSPTAGERDYDLEQWMILRWASGGEVLRAFYGRPMVARANLEVEVYGEEHDSIERIAENVKTLLVRYPQGESEEHRTFVREGINIDNPIDGPILDIYEFGSEDDFDEDRLMRRTGSGGKLSRRLEFEVVYVQALQSEIRRQP